MLKHILAILIKWELNTIKYKKKKSQLWLCNIKIMDLPIVLLDLNQYFSLPRALKPKSLQSIRQTRTLFFFKI